MFKYRQDCSIRVMNILLCLTWRESPWRAIFHGNLVELFLCFGRADLLSLCLSCYFFLAVNNYEKCSWVTWEKSCFCQKEHDEKLKAIAKFSRSHLQCDGKKKKSVWYWLRAPAGFSSGEEALISKCVLDLCAAFLAYVICAINFPNYLNDNFLVIFLYSGSSVVNINPANYHYVNIPDLSWGTAE